VKILYILEMTFEGIPSTITVVTFIRNVLAYILVYLRTLQGNVRYQLGWG